MSKKIPPQTFRANVGAIIINGAGLVLALERKEIPGSWQCPQGGLDEGEEPLEAVRREILEETGIKASSLEVPADTLSGGNQQKVVISKWLLSKPKVLIMDDPTRGIDVGAKFEIYKLMNELAEQGEAIIMISSELEEVLGMSDRIMVMCRGHSTATLSASEATQERVMELATGISAA